MQNTRFNTLVETTIGQINQIFSNPWRRTSLLIISVLLGFFLGSAIPTTAGQNSDWDTFAAAIMALVVEGISRFIYRRDRTSSRSLWIEVLNSLKIGLVYGLFLEAFKLAS